MKHLNANYNAIPTSEAGLGPLFEIDKNGGEAYSPSSKEITGKELKEKGLKLVRENNENWMERAIEWSEAFVILGHYDFTGEDIRFYVEKYAGSPRHPNAYGALINTLIKRKIIVPTGEHRQMKDSRSHARSTPVYKAP